MGTDEGFDPLPVTAEGFTTRGRVVPFASLFKVTTRAAFYKEPMVPASSKTFHAEQR